MKYSISVLPSKIDDMSAKELADFVQVRSIGLVQTEKEKQDIRDFSEALPLVANNNKLRFIDAMQKIVDDSQKTLNYSEEKRKPELKKAMELLKDKINGGERL